MTDPREKKRIKVQPTGAGSSRGDDDRADSAVAPDGAAAAGGPEAAAAHGAAAQASAPATVDADDAAINAAASAVADAIEERLTALATERDEYLTHLQRLQAEFDNYRKRVQRDSEANNLRASEGVVESLLPVLDNLQRAEEAAAGRDGDQLAEGVELVAGQLRAVLESHGLQEVEAAAGVPFDPNVHEAVLAQPHDDFPEGTVTQVLARGYLLHGRLLRPTKVIVAA